MLELLRIASYMAIIAVTLTIGVRLGKMVHPSLFLYHLAAALLIVILAASTVGQALHNAGLISAEAQRVWSRSMRILATPVVLGYAVALLGAWGIWARVRRS